MMAASTVFVLAAGGMVVAEELLVKKDTDIAVKAGAASAFAAILAAGLDKVVPGLGTGLGMIMVAAAALTFGVPLLEFVTGQKLGTGNV